MNANELADELEDAESYVSQDIDDRDYAMICRAATMLRQQQAEIEALKTDNKRLKEFCWESDAAVEFLKSIKEAQEK